MASGAPSEAGESAHPSRPPSPFANAKTQLPDAAADRAGPDAQPSSAAMSPMRVLQEALAGGRRVPQGHAKRIVHERPLPELPPPEAVLHTEASTPSQKHVRMSNDVSLLLPPALSAQPSSQGPSEAAAHTEKQTNASTTSSGTPHSQHQPHHPSSSTPSSAASTKPPPSAAARASALRPSMVKGGQRKHAAPGPPPPRKVGSVDGRGSSVMAAGEVPQGGDGGRSRNSLKKNLSLYLEDDTPGEVQRDAEGNRLSILQVIEHDAGVNEEVKDPQKLKAQREEFLLKNRAVRAESVPELHKRLQQRREVTNTLTKWTETVLKKRATEGGEDEYVDAEQLEEESRLSKMGGMGVGAALRAYWNATVQEEVELRFNTMRSAWEKEAAADMAELKDLRDKGKKLKKELDDAKQELAGMQIKYEVAQKQVVSAQRNITAKQNAPSESDGKLSAGQQAVVEATMSQLKSDINSLKGQLDAMASKSGFYQAEASKIAEDLNASQMENAALLAKLRDAEAQLVTKKIEAEKPAQKVPDAEGQGSKDPPPREKPAPTKVPVADPEGQKAKKDLDKLQNEHAKLQIAMRTKSNEVEKLAKELKEARMKSSARASPAGASGAAAPTTTTTTAAPRTSGGAPKAGSQSRSLSGKQKSMSNKGRSAQAATEPSSGEATQSHTAHEGGSGAEEGGKGAGGRLAGRKSHSGRKAHAPHSHHQQQQQQPHEQGQELQQHRVSGEGSGAEGGRESSGGEFLGRRVSGGSRSHGASRAVSGDGEAAGPSVFQTMKSKRRSQDKPHQGAGGSPPQARISQLEATIAKLQDQLRSERNRPNSPSKPTKRPSGPLMSAKEEAELKVANAQIKELNALVERLQKEIKSLKESSSIQQQELTLDVELNKRLRLMQKLKKGAGKVEVLLHGGSQDVGDEGLEDKAANHEAQLKQQIDVGTRELEALIQDLEAEFGKDEAAAQQSLRLQRRSSARGHRFTLDSQDLSSLLKSSSKKIQQLHNVRGSVSGMRQEGPVGMIPPLPLSMLPATARDDPSPTARQADASARAMSFGHNAHEQGPASEGEGAQVAASAAQPGQEGAAAWEDHTQTAEQMKESSAGPGVRFAPTQSQLPRGRGTGVGVATVMGRHGPQVYGQRPASAQPATSSLYGTIEDATRWGGMFERLHASYLDPNGVWRVYTRTDGPTEQVDSLQPLLEGAQRAAQRADAAARAAATTLDVPTQAAGVASTGNSDWGRALEPTRRPRSAYPAPVASQHPSQHSQLIHQGMHSATPTLPPGLHGGYEYQGEVVYPTQHVLHQQHARAHAASRPTSRSPSPSAQQGWPHQEARTTGPPLLRHNLYQQQPDQPPGGYNVRLLTATPQKGIQLRTRPRSAHPSTHAAGHWELGPGEGEPQSPPPPQPFVLSERLGNNIGLSVPQHSWSLQQPGSSPPTSPAGGMLHMPGSSVPTYNGIEMMSRMELVKAVKEMEAFVKDVALRYNRMIADQQHNAKLRSELALEIAEAREHWVAENEYNLHLQVELERLHAILQRIAAEAALDKRDSEGSDHNASLGLGSPSSSVLTAQAAMNRANQVKELQESHVAEAESAAERMRLPSPSAIRAKFKHGQAQLQLGSGGDGVRQEQQQPGAEGVSAAAPVAGCEAGTEEQLAPWPQED